MYQKSFDEQLNFIECLQLINACVKAELLMTDPNNENNLLVYREAGENAEKYPEGWYSENAHDVARDLRDDIEGQHCLRLALEEKGIELAFGEYFGFMETQERKKNHEEKEL